MYRVLYVFILYAVYEVNADNVVLGIPGLYDGRCLLCTPILRVEKNSQQSSPCSAPCAGTESTPVGLTHCMFLELPQCQVASTLCAHYATQYIVTGAEYRSCQSTLRYSGLSVTGEADKVDSQAPGLLVSYNRGEYTLSCANGESGLSTVQWHTTNFTAQVPRCTPAVSPEMTLPWWYMVVASLVCLLAGLIIPTLYYKICKTHKISTSQTKTSCEANSKNPYASFGKKTQECDEYAEVNLVALYSNVGGVDSVNYKKMGGEQSACSQVEYDDVMVG